MNLVARLFLLLLAFFSLSMRWPDPYQILDEADLMLEQFYWRSGVTNPDDWNQISPLHWVCFDYAEARAYCAGEDGQSEDEDGFESILEIERGQQDFLFRFSENQPLESCQEEVNQYIDLISSNRDICVFGSYEPLQNDWSDVTSSLSQEFSEWYGYGLKTMNGKIIAPVFQSK